MKVDVLSETVKQCRDSGEHTIEFEPLRGWLGRLTACRSLFLDVGADETTTSSNSDAELTDVLDDGVGCLSVGHRNGS